MWVIVFPRKSERKIAPLGLGNAWRRQSATVTGSIYKLGFASIQFTHVDSLLRVGAIPAPWVRDTPGNPPRSGQGQPLPTWPLSEYNASNIHSISRRHSPGMSASNSIPGLSGSMSILQTIANHSMTKGKPRGSAPAIGALAQNASINTDPMLYEQCATTHDDKLNFNLSKLMATENTKLVMKNE